MTRPDRMLGVFRRSCQVGICWVVYLFLAKLSFAASLLAFTLFYDPASTAVEQHETNLAVFWLLTSIVLEVLLLIRLASCVVGRRKVAMHRRDRLWNGEYS